MAEGNKTVLGVTENLEALLCYAAGWVSGAVLLFIEKENRFVRFHAMQSLVTFLALWIVFFVLQTMIGIIPMAFTYFLFYGLTGVVAIVYLFLWILLMVKAWNGQWYRLPVAGDFAAKQLGMD